MLGYKTSLNQLKNTEIIQSMLTDHNGIKPEINSRRKKWKTHKHVEIKQYTLKQPMGQRTNHKGS